MEVSSQGARGCFLESFPALKPFFGGVSVQYRVRVVFARIAELRYQGSVQQIRALIELGRREKEKKVWSSRSLIVIDFFSNYTFLCSFSSLD